MALHRSTSISLILVALLSLPGAPAVVGSGSGSGRVAKDTIGSGPVERVIVRWATTVGTERGLSRAMRMTSAHAGTRRAAVVSGDTEAWWLPEPLSGADLLTTLADIAATPGVVEVAVDRRLTADLVPNDPSFGAQWDMGGGYGVHATTAWDTTTGSPGTVVAVIDTGITVHSELAGQTVPGYDFISDLPTANDGDGRDPDPSDPGDWITSAESCLGTVRGLPGRQLELARHARGRHDRRPRQQRGRHRGPRVGGEDPARPGARQVRRLDERHRGRDPLGGRRQRARRPRQRHPGPDPQPLARWAGRL